jgi:hypothetical protein
VSLVQLWESIEAVVPRAELQEAVDVVAGMARQTSPTPTPRRGSG